MPNQSSEKTGQNAIERRYTECKFCGHETRPTDLSNGREIHHRTCNACTMFWTRHRFRLTPADREKLNAKPYCGCCGSTKNLCIDHCHETNAIRGYLCRPCNKALGALGDNLEGVSRIVAYLKEHTSNTPHATTTDTTN